MTSLFFAMLGFGSLMAFSGFLIAWIYRSQKIEELNSDLEIKQESYQALKGQYETNIKKYEVLYHKHIKLEEENESIIGELEKLERQISALKYKISTSISSTKNHSLAQQDSDFKNEQKPGEALIGETILQEDTIKDITKQIEIEK